MRKKVFRLSIVLLAVAAIAAASWALAARPIPGGGCPRYGIYCPDVYDPVTCSNGVTYSNACYAWVACATGCNEGHATQ